ncbi:hypothetical protein MUY35_02950 [Aliiroseovarius sp. S1339]|uniref:hypothetical protein n=1 Tax=Aliiroseovarius sp. S1339 TaxID=2936990 RepID=UPI0020C0627C|nr:hypothetical protein [Aliiroseovarius sp. S1339]MCK8462805.1 hypothetical protein [Aliiroseovarius sp. S1339]
MTNGNNESAMLEMSMALKNISTVLEMLLDGDLLLEVDQTRKGIETVRGYTSLVGERLFELSQSQNAFSDGSSIQHALIN